MGPLGLDVVCFDDFETAPAHFEAQGFGSFVEPKLIGLWRHSYGVERKLVKLILDRAKTGSEGAKEAKTYYRLINNGTFFARTPEESLAMLYEAFMDHPKLTLGYGLEVDGGTFDPYTPTTPSASVQAAMRDGTHAVLQACMYFEHRAPLDPQGRRRLRDRPGGPAVAGLAGREVHLPWPDLPQPPGVVLARNGLAPRAAELPALRDVLAAVPVGWGGFYLEDRKDKEFEWMSAYSGIPVDEIPTALESFDRIFPVPAGWFVTTRWTDVRMVKMVPPVFQGIGAHHRRAQYGLGDSISGLKASSQYTHSDLAKRINGTVEFLLAELK